MVDPDDRASSSDGPLSSDDFRTLHFKGKKKTVDLPSKASYGVLNHNHYLGTILDLHLGGGTGISTRSEVARLPPRRLHSEDPSGRAFRYPTVRRLIDLAHATKKRPEGAAQAADVVVSVKERELLFEWRPLLENHDGFRALAQYLLHHTFRTDKEGNILASFRKLRSIYGLDPNRKRGSFPQDARALELLWLYALFIDPEIRWTLPHSSARARTVERHGTPEEIREEARKVAREGEGVASVGLFSGATASNYRKRKALGVLLERAESYGPKVEMPDATEKIIEYHNGLVRSRGGKDMFTNLSKKADRAVDLLTSGMQHDEDFEEGVKASTRRVRAFEHLPRPVYRKADYTPRPVSVGRNHPMQLPGEVLEAMFTPRYVYLDGSKIQLALFEKLARDMGVSCLEIQDHLRRHLDGEFDLWSEIGSAIDLPDGDARRQAAKRATYAALYFSGKPNLTRVLCSEYAKATNMDSWPDGDDVEGFFGHPVIRDLSTASNSMREILAEKGEIEDAFGVVRAAKDFEERGNPKRTLLSCVLQGHELRLMQPLYDETIKEQERDRADRFRIAIYKYDGIVVWIREGHKERDRKKWIGCLQSAFDEGAEDVLSRLDVEQIGPPES